MHCTVESSDVGVIQSYMFENGQFRFSNIRPAPLCCRDWSTTDVLGYHNRLLELANENLLERKSNDRQIEPKQHWHQKLWVSASEFYFEDFSDFQILLSVIQCFSTKKQGYLSNKNKVRLFIFSWQYKQSPSTDFSPEGLSWKQVELCLSALSRAPYLHLHGWACIQTPAHMHVHTHVLSLIHSTPALADALEYQIREKYPHIAGLWAWAKTQIYQD